MQAPSIKLYEFNYLFNKAINQYINKVYNSYDLDQQRTDDLRVLKSTAYLTPTIWKSSVQSELGGTINNPSDNQAKSYLSKSNSRIQSLHGATYEAILPQDYLHLLNCVCIYYVAKTKDCWDAGSYIEIPATRLTADSWSQIITDIYNRPSPMKPYYYIHNQNISSIPNTNPITAHQNAISGSGTETTISGTDMRGTYEVTSNGTVNDNAEMTYPNPSATIADSSNKTGSNFPRTIKIDTDGDGTVDTNISLVEKPIATRVSNPSGVRLEIRYGKDNTLFQLKEVQVDYVKSPQYIRLTQEQIDLTEDTSQIMEFPDYVNQEIINELVHLVMEHTNNPRLSNNIQMTQSIARPTGQQAQQAQA